MAQSRAARGRERRGVARLRVYLVAACAVLVAGVSASPASARWVNPLAGRGMWIWYVSQTDGGNVSRIIGGAKYYGVSTVFIKSGDGSGVWSQFTPGLVRALHAAGLRVCGWQYVYGNSPASEAQVGAYAAHAGADCLMIDAEGEYEGKYISAQTYIHTLRSLIGNSFPVALAGLPYVDYHPGFPYSVFLGPGGAQYNAPQMYWRDIGTTVDAVYAHTYAFNQVYQRSIFPLGQVSGSPPSSQILRFREFSRLYGASGVSWWQWTEAGASGWRAISRPAGRLSRAPARASAASVGPGAQGDLVVWAQEHLRSAGYRITIDGGFGPATQAAVVSFQRAKGLSPDGLIGPATWRALLRYRPVSVTWTSSGARIASAARTGTLRLPLPKSARLPSRGNELHGHPGRGSGH